MQRTATIQHQAADYRPEQPITHRQKFYATTIEPTDARVNRVTTNDGRYTMANYAACADIRTPRFRYSQVIYRYCQRKGHMKRECRFKKRAEKAKWQWNDNDRRHGHDRQRRARYRDTEHTQMFSLMCKQMDAISAILKRLAQRSQTNGGCNYCTSHSRTDQAHTHNDNSHDRQQTESTSVGRL